MRPRFYRHKTGGRQTPRAAAALIAACAGVAGLCAEHAQAGTRRDDVVDPSYTAFGTQATFAGVGACVSDVALNGNSAGALQGSGELISDRWVLTSGHVVNVKSGGTSYTTTAVHFNAGGTDASNGTPGSGGEWFSYPTFTPLKTAVPTDPGPTFDIALVHLTSAITNIAPLVRFTGTTESGLGSIIGYGTTGTGSFGATIAYGTKRGGTNDIDQVGSFTNNNNLLGLDFDNPDGSTVAMGSPVAKSLEYLGTKGDSGGGLFVNVSGAQQLAGILSFGAATNGKYGDTDYFVRVNQFNAWIDDQISARYWHSAANGSFGVGTNWDEGSAPGSGNIAVFDLPGAYTVSLASAVTNKRIRVRAGDVSMNLGASTYTLGSSTLENSLTVARQSIDTASLTLSSGTLAAINVGIGELSQAVGKLTIDNGGTLTASSTIAVAGSLNTAGGTGTLQINAAGTLKISGGMNVFGLGRVVNNGTVSWASGAIGNAGIINNNATGLLDVQGNLSLTSLGGSPSLTNAGTIRKSSASGLATIAIPLTNTGTIQVQVGSVSFTGGGTSNGGTFLTSASTRIDLNGASAFAFSGANTITGSGLVAIASNTTNSGTLKVDTSALLIASGTLNSSGTLDLNGKMILDYSGATPIANIKSKIVTGYASARARAGAGINSSSAAAVAADSSNLRKTGIGYGETSSINPGTFGGQTPDQTSLLLRYTLLGDANLDGTVNTGDFTLLSTNFNKSNQFWNFGDFSYDGIVNALDFNALASNFGSSIPGPPLDGASLGALVPEPDCILIGSVALIGLRRRRRR